MTDANTVDGMCMVCGDKSAGKHYGVMACYGCKGFFRRTIRSKQNYSCRFAQCCGIDKDQRNACRFCRFQRCLQVGMEPDAIRPDRDVIGKQKNPRKRKLVISASSIATFGCSTAGNINGFVLKQEESSLPSPGTESNSSQNSEDHLLSALMDVDMRHGNSNKSVDVGSSVVTSFANAFGAGTCATSASSAIPIGIAPPPHHQMLRRTIKMDPDVKLVTLIQNRALLEELRCAAIASSSFMSIASNTNLYGFGHTDIRHPHSSPLSEDGENSCDALFKCSDTASSRLYIPPMHLLTSKSASVEQISEAMRLYVLACIGWINAMFRLARLETDTGVASLGTNVATLINDKMIILKNTFAAFCTFEQATQTARAATTTLTSSSPIATISTAFDENSSLCLCNGRWIARNADRQYLDTNLLANNIVGRILDELVFPLRRLRITDQERVTLTALIILEGDCRRVDARTSAALYALKERVQNALFQHIRERDVGDASLSRASTRFANVLLLLPSVAKVSAIYYENAQLAKMFGHDSLDPLLAEIFLDASSSPSTVMTASGGGIETFHQHATSSASRPHIGAGGQTISTSDLYDGSLNKGLTISSTNIDNSEILSSTIKSCGSIMATLKTSSCLMSISDGELFDSSSGGDFSPPNVLPLTTAAALAGSSVDTVSCYENAKALGECRTLQEKASENTSPSSSSGGAPSILSAKLTSSTSMTTTIFNSSFKGEVRSADDEDQMSSIVDMGLELADEQQRHQQLLLMQQEGSQTSTTLRHSHSVDDVVAATSSPDEGEASFLMQHLFPEKGELNESSGASAAHTARHYSGKSVCSKGLLSLCYENSSIIDAAPSNSCAVGSVANVTPSPNLEPISPPHSAFNAPEVFSHHHLSSTSVVTATVSLSSTSSVVAASPAVASFPAASAMDLQGLYGSASFYSAGKSDGESTLRVSPLLEFDAHQCQIASSSSADLFMECGVSAPQIAAYPQQYHNGDIQQRHHEQQEQQQEYFLNELQNHRQQLLLQHHQQQMLQQQLLSRSHHHTSADSSSSSTAVVDGGSSTSGCNFGAFSS